VAGGPCSRLIDRTPNLDWLLLTKRVGNVLVMLLEIGRDRLPVNVWQGISAVNQDEARRDLPKLARIEATVRWVSYEPALGELDLFDRRC
jgi:protein gp37